jgi:uncharacterized protein
MSAAAQQKPVEPSMEEILASIRRIISDDQALQKQGPALAAPPPVPALAAPPVMADMTADDDILELKRPPQPVQTEYLNDDPVPQDLHFAEAPVVPTVVANDMRPLIEPEPAPVIVAPAPAPQALPREAERLLSSETDAAVASAFGALATTVLSNNARTLEDLVRDMLKPMIKTWLDDNLPTLVERLVRAEIERVARGGR